MLQTSSKEVVNEQVDDTQALDYKGLCGGKKQGLWSQEDPGHNHLSTFQENVNLQGCYKVYWTKNNIPSKLPKAF